MAAAKKTAPTAAEVSAAFRLIADWVDAGGSIPGAVKGGSSTAAAAEDKFDEDEIRGLAVGELRTLAAELGLNEQKVKSKILEEMASKGLFETSEDEDEEPEDEEDEDDTSEDEDGDEEEELTREDLEEMDLKALRDLAKEEGHARGDYIKADKDALIDLLLGEDEEEDEEEDEDDEDGDEEESEELDEEEIRAMSLAEVKKLAVELGVKVPPTIAKNRKKIADKILAEVAEEE